MSQLAERQKLEIAIGALEHYARARHHTAQVALEKISALSHEPKVSQNCESASSSIKSGEEQWRDIANKNYAWAVELQVKYNDLEKRCQSDINRFAEENAKLHAAVRALNETIDVCDTEIARLDKEVRHLNQKLENVRKAAM